MLLVGPKAGPPGPAQKPRDQLWAGRGWGGAGFLEITQRAAVMLDPKWPRDALSVLPYDKHNNSFRVSRLIPYWFQL